MADFTLELVSPERMLFSGPVESVIVPASEGEMTVLAGHAPTMTTLNPGVITVREGSGATRRLFVQGGFADIGAASLSILAEQAIALEDVNADTLAADIRLAEDGLRDAATQVERDMAQARLDALTALKTAVSN